MSENGTQENTEELDELRAEKVQLEAMVEALQARELELSRELLQYLKAERSQLRERLSES